MRFRSLGQSGKSVSAISLSLGDGTRLSAHDWLKLIYSALECGINCFEVVGREPAIAEGLAQALSAVERRLVFVVWRLGSTSAPGSRPVRDFSAAALAGAVQSALTRTGLGYLDAVVLDDPNDSELSPQALTALKAMRDAGHVRMLGVAGEDDAIDAYISTGAFDLLCTPFNLISGWKERLRLKSAMALDMAVFGYGYYPEAFHKAQAAAAPKTGILNRANPLAGVGTYRFLDKTKGWAAEEICLAHALTEPALATVQIVADRAERIEALASVPERDMPPGVSAQIEMARFAPTAPVPEARRA